MDIPNPGDNDFDRDITSDEIDSDSLAIALHFVEMRDLFEIMTAAGFTERQAIRFLAYCFLNGDEE